MDVKLCIYMPTCNRRECIARILSTEIELLRKANVDIRIYDSSTGNDTKSLVLDYQNKGYENLFYEHVDYSIHPNRKAYQIFQEAELTNYDYIWLLHDHTVCTDISALSYILYYRFGSAGIWSSWPVGWTIAMIISVICYFSGVWMKKFKR